MSNTQLNNKSFSDDKSGLVSQKELSPEEFDRQLRASLRKTFPKKKRISLAAVPAGPGTASTERAACAAGCPILDTPTPFVTHLQKGVSPRFKRTFTKSHRRMYNRIIMGMYLPGRYYFLTLTSTPTSPPIKKSWKNFHQWLSRHRPGITWCHCLTCEGHGVIHMVLRLGMRQKMLDVKEVRAYWVRLTGANQIKIKRVRDANKKDLADYLVNQKLKKSMGREMAFQGSSIISWKWKEGWLPKGFTKLFAKEWRRVLCDIPYPALLDQQISFLVHRAYEAEKAEAVKLKKELTVNAR